MPISEEFRILFEGVGFARIHRELRVGSSQFLIGDEARRQAEEWVNEQLAIRRRLEARNLAGIVAAIVAAIASVIAAIASLIAAWPVISGWFGR